MILELLLEQVKQEDLVSFDKRMKGEESKRPQLIDESTFSAEDLQVELREKVDKIKRGGRSEEDFDLNDDSDWVGRKLVDTPSCSNDNPNSEESKEKLKKFLATL